MLIHKDWNPPKIFSDYNGMGSQINSRRKPGKFTYVMKLNTLLNNQWVKEEVKKYLETNENGIKTCQNLWDTATADLRRKLIAVNAYIKKRIISKNLNWHLKEEEKAQIKPKASRREAIVEITAKIHVIFIMYINAHRWLDRYLDTC